MSRELDRRHERGTAMLVTTAFMAVVLGVVATMISLILVRSKSEVERLAVTEVARTSEAGLAIAVGQIGALNPAPAQVSATATTGAKWSAVIRKNSTSPDFYKVSIVSGNRSAYHVVQAVVEATLPPVPAGIGGAMQFYNSFEIANGNVVLAGENHDMNGNVVAGSAASVVLHGNAQNLNLNGNIQQTGAEISYFPMPASPGPFVNMTDQQLIQIAQTNGTFFTSASQVTTWTNGLGAGYAPNTSPIYLHFSESLTAQSVINGINFDPSKAYVVIMHLPNGSTATSANPWTYEPGSNGPANGIATTGIITNKTIKGIVILDNFRTFNGSWVDGTLVSLYQGFQSLYMSAASGQDRLLFSPEAIGRALRDSLGQTGTPKIVSFRENVTLDAEVYLAMQGCGIDTSAMPAAVAANSTGWVNP